jgi:hypothetical protein
MRMIQQCSLVVLAWGLAAGTAAAHDFNSSLRMCR